MYPENLRYTKDHEWILVEGGTGTVGITDHAQEELGDIVFVDLPKPGTKLEEHGSLGSVESVKAVSEIYCPAAGVSPPGLPSPSTSVGAELANRKVVRVIETLKNDAPPCRRQDHATHHSRWIRRLPV